MAKRASEEKKREIVSKVLSMQSEGATIGEACERLGIGRHNFMNWRKKFSDAAPVARASGKSENGYTAIRVSGSTDMMFIGFGRSKDVLTAIDGLASIFGSRAH